MIKNKTTGRWQIIGLGYGGGYSCGKEKGLKKSSSTIGLWSSVPAQMEWVKEVMAEYSTECNEEDQENQE